MIKSGFYSYGSKALDGVDGGPQAAIEEFCHFRQFQRVRNFAIYAAEFAGLPRSTDIVRPARLVRFVPKAEVAAAYLC
jgi:hypothetical protein